MVINMSSPGKFDQSQNIQIELFTIIKLVEIKRTES